MAMYSRQAMYRGVTGCSAGDLVPHRTRQGLCGCRGESGLGSGSPKAQGRWSAWGQGAGESRGDL